MFAHIQRAKERLFNRSAGDTSVPVFDGAFKPNNLLDTAEILFEHPELADMVIDSRGELFVACGNKVLRATIGQDKGIGESIAELSNQINVLCSFKDGLVAATEDGIFFVTGQYAGREVSSLQGRVVQCVTGMCEGPNGTLLITLGSSRTKHDHWATDLLNGGKTGCLIAYDPVSESVRIDAEGLAYPCGVISDGSRAMISESWAHRVLVWRDGVSQTGLSELPGYPSRMSIASDGGYWLTIFAPRSQLLEFVLRERDFRNEMMRTVDPKYWIAPALSSGKDFLEPLQQGGVRQMGVLKPWAPARSYGLVVKLSSDLVPIYSLHSRVGGSNHGVVAAIELDNSLLVLSKGSRRVLRVPIASHQLQD
jgi:hypothetical protein